MGEKGERMGDCSHSHF